MRVWFSKLISMTEKGHALNLKETEKLYKALGMKGGQTRFFGLVFMLVILSALIYVALGNTTLYPYKNAAYVLLLTGLMALLVVLYVFFPKRKRLIKYLNALKIYHEKKLLPYKGFVHERVDYRPSMNNPYLQKHAIHLLTDGYNFILYDDFLKDSNYGLSFRFKTKKNPEPRLRLLDEACVNKPRLIFKLSDVNYFRLIAEEKVKPAFPLKKMTLGALYEPYTSPNKNLTERNFVLVLLEDETSYRFGIDSISLFRQIMPHKERKGD